MAGKGARFLVTGPRGAIRCFLKGRNKSKSSPEEKSFVAKQAKNKWFRVGLKKIRAACRSPMVC